ncbi:hypothetical protein BP6252_11612 [Coleophoma cylindrospora]|uniref:HAD-like protein n=1 Tax=Coleophoma cylindrospora TaxID=1849047 RepID=A0A3D8QK71_9HELO|nr:hypothetical protein BP6252_11612 [Coleophoma cylindrospora]
MPTPHPSHQTPKPKALIFDLMGTCTNWQSSLLPHLTSAPSPALSPRDALALAADWRAGFFREIHARFERGAEGEDIDVTHARVLDRLLVERRWDWGDGEKERCVDAWHAQVDGLGGCAADFGVLSLAGCCAGTGEVEEEVFCPDPRIYLKAIELLQLRPEECIMVAAHAYDLRAAKGVGMQTIYIHRTTEDLDEDMSLVEKENDRFLDGTTGGVDCGLGALADVLDA